MKIRIVWTEALVSTLSGSIVTNYDRFDLSVLCWRSGERAENVYYLMDARDGMLLELGTKRQQVADKLNEMEIAIYHERAGVTITGKLL